MGFCVFSKCWGGWAKAGLTVKHESYMYCEGRVGFTEHAECYLSLEHAERDATQKEARERERARCVKSLGLEKTALVARTRHRRNQGIHIPGDDRLPGETLHDLHVHAVHGSIEGLAPLHQPNDARVNLSR